MNRRTALAALAAAPIVPAAALAGQDASADAGIMEASRRFFAARAQLHDPERPLVGSEEEGDVLFRRMEAAVPVVMEAQPATIAGLVAQLEVYGVWRGPDHADGSDYDYPEYRDQRTVLECAKRLACLVASPVRGEA